MSVVDGAGFLRLMELAEPRYVVPCRKTIMEAIDSRYIKQSVSEQPNVTLTTDMWTSRAGDGYISLTAHYLTSSFVFESKTLQCLPLPGRHDHTLVSSSIRSCTDDWLVDIDTNVTAFTTDNGSNVVKAVEDDLRCARIPCAGHTLNLAVSAGLAISSAIGRKVVGHFNHSRIDQEELKKKQDLLGIPNHQLI